MSHLTASIIRIADIDILKKAVKGFDGLKWNEGAKKFSSYGDASWQKEQTEQYGNCEHSISGNGCHYQIGVIKTADGDWALAYDEDDRMLRELVGSRSVKLMAAYGEAYARDWAEKKGFMIETGYDEDGNLQLSMIDPN